MKLNLWVWWLELVQSVLGAVSGHVKGNTLPSVERGISVVEGVAQGIEATQTPPAAPVPAPAATDTAPQSGTPGN